MKEEIRKYLEHLSSIEAFDEEQQASIFREEEKEFIYPASIFLCTNSALRVAHKFNGQVFGYDLQNKPQYKNKLAYDYYGHDFAVVGSFIVDWWAKNIDGQAFDILDMDNPEDMEIIKEKYLPRAEWSPVAQEIIKYWVYKSKTTI